MENDKIDLTNEYVAFMLRRISREIQMGFKKEDMENHVKDNIFEAKFDHLSFGEKSKRTRTTIRIEIENI